MNGEPTPLDSLEPEVQVVLSRPAYRLGGTVVGTVRLVGEHPRALYESAQVYAAGRCRIDARWHNAERYKQLYGSHPLLASLMDSRVEERVVAETDSRDGSTVCFLATNVVHLLDLEERQVGRWEDVKPQPLKTSGAPWEKLFPQNLESTSTENGSSIAAAGDQKHTSEPARGGKEKIEEDPLARNQLSFTFRVDLPLDLAPTITATSCRYFYSVVVCAKTTQGELMVVQAPFKVMSPLGGKRTIESLASAVRVKLGTCHAVAHSMGLPCHISATELCRPSGQITVNRDVGLLPAAQDFQTMRVADEDGTLCCVLTVMGSSVVSPGGRLLLQFDFPRDRGDGTPDSLLERLPCYQVSACLEGEELVVNEDGTRHRARSYLLGGAHEQVESGNTDRVSLSLCLPLDCPFTIQTELIKIDVWCKVELTVEQPGSKGYSNLRLGLPCQVVPSATADEMRGDEEGDYASQMVSLEELVLGKKSKAETEGAPQRFRSDDIMKDLKALSLRMIDDSGLREESVK